MNECLISSIKDLRKQNKISFNVKDMLKGHCIFERTSQITEVIQQIRKFVMHDKEKRFRIVKISNNIVNCATISGVTLTIAIKEEILAELELTVERFVPAFKFQRTIQEISSSQVFSQLKTVYDIYTKEQAGFEELSYKTIQLAKQRSQTPVNNLNDSEIRAIQRARLIVQQTANIQAYFGLSLQERSQQRSFTQILSQTLYKNPKQSKLWFNVTINTDLQALMLPLFCKQMGRWDKDLGKMIDQVISKPTTCPKLKATLVAHFFESFDLTKEIDRMQHFKDKYWSISLADRKSYIQEYLRHYFAIEDVFQPWNATHRIYWFYEHFKGICISNSSALPSLSQDKFVDNILFEEKSPENLATLTQFMNIHFHLKQANGVYSLQFEQYYKWIAHIITNKPCLDYQGKAFCTASLLMAQKMLQENKLSKARKLIDQAMTIFKKTQDHSRILECQLLSFEWIIKSSARDNIKISLAQLTKQYDRQVRDKASSLGLQMSGVLVANAEWRIASHYWEEYTDRTQRRQILQTHFSKALEESSRSQGVDLIVKMNKIWGEYTSYQAKLPQIRQQQAVLAISLKAMDVAACFHLNQANWKNLRTLDMKNSRIGQQGCQYLVQADWKNLTSLNLTNSLIEKAGCAHLSKASWKKLRVLNLGGNKIGAQGCAYLSSADWKDLQQLDLRRNNIGNKGCAYLSRAAWKRLRFLHISCNNIDDGGCCYLSRANWQFLQCLNLSRNFIKDKGCAPLVKAHWNNLTELNLNNNVIGDIGALNLLKANWDRLGSLSLGMNRISEAYQQKITNMFSDKGLEVEPS